MEFSSVYMIAGILLGCSVTLFTAYLIGRAVLAQFPKLTQDLSAAEGLVFSLGTGSACLSNLVFVLCAGGVFHETTVVGLAVLAVGAYLRWGRRGAFERRFGNDADFRTWLLMLLLVALPYGYLYLAHSLAPEISADGVGYHLGLVRRYYEAQGFPGITTNMYAYLSQGAEMLYLFAYALGRHSAAKMVHFSLFVATVVAMLAFSRRYRIWRAGVAGAVLYACSPVVGTDAASTYNDCALAFFQFLTIYGLLLWWNSRDRGWLVILGILAGFCFSIKYTGFAAIPLLLVAIAWGSWQRLFSLRTAFRRAALVAAVAAFFVLPWTLKNALSLGNPTAPFFNRLFLNPYVTISFENTYRNYLEDYSHADEPLTWYEFAEELTLRGARLQGLLGPVFLLTPLAVLGWRRRPTKTILASGVVFALPWLANAGTRFLIPSLVLFSLGIGMLLQLFGRRMAALAGCLVLGFHAVSSWPSVLRVWHPEPVWSLHENIPWQAALRLQPEAEYLERYVAHYGAAQIINAEARPEDRVLSLEPLPEAYFSAEQLVYYQGAENEQLVDVVRIGADPQFWPARSLQLEWPSKPLAGFRVVQRNEDPSTQWSVSEIRLLSDGAYFAPEADWQIRADPFPWAAARALDSNPFTAWNSWQPLFDGMKVEVRFEKPRELSGAEVVLPWRQHNPRLEFFGQDVEGRWVPLDASTEERRLPVSVIAARHWVGEELRRHNISFLVTDTAGAFSDISKKIDEDPAAWGLKEIGRDGAIRIYRVS